MGTSYRLIFNTFEEHDRRNRKRLSSHVRDWKIAGTPEDYGNYTVQPDWAIHASDVAMAGREGYEARVQLWAESVYKDLEKTGNLQ
ncbi:MAG: hypothetical protein V4478_01685 [Patescibacteria group bacterium]